MRSTASTPDGAVELVAHDDRAITLNRPANVAFGGEDFDRLFIANLGGSFISVLDAGVRRATALGRALRRSAA